MRRYAGIDTDEWPDASGYPKDIDFLIYDKIRWNHDKLAIELLQPIRKMLQGRGLLTHTIRYKFRDRRTYRRLLQRSRAMIFLCVHETQGLAYQRLSRQMFRFWRGITATGWIHCGGVSAQTRYPRPPCHSSLANVVRHFEIFRVSKQPFPFS